MGKDQLYPWHQLSILADIDWVFYDVGICSMTVTFVEADGKTEQTVQAKLGTSLLEVAHTYDIDLEGAQPKLNLGECLSAESSSARLCCQSDS